MRAGLRIPAPLRHSSSLALIDQAVVSGTNFFTTLVIARVCGKAELGLYLLAWTVIVIASDILTAIITTPYVVMSPMVGAGQESRLRGSAMVHQFALSSLACACLLVAAIHLRPGDKSDLGRVLGVLACLIVVLIFKEFARRMWFAHLEMLTAVIADASACALQLALIIILAAGHSLNTVTTYAVIAGVSVLPCVIWVRMYRRRLTVSAATAMRDFRTNWKLAKWIAGSGALWAGAMYTYPWLLVWAKGTTATGVWAACFGLVALSNPVLLGFGNYLGPRIAILQGHGGLAAMRSYVYRSTVLFVSLLLPFALLIWFWGDPMVRRLYGASFLGHSTVIKILAINVLISGAVFPFSRGFFALHRAEVDFAANLVAVAFLFIFGVGLVRSYGVIGAALGLTLTNGSTALIRAAIFAKITRVQHSGRSAASGIGMDVPLET